MCYEVATLRVGVNLCFDVFTQRLPRITHSTEQTYSCIQVVCNAVFVQGHSQLEVITEFVILAVFMFCHCCINSYPKWSFHVQLKADLSSLKRKKRGCLSFPVSLNCSLAFISITEPIMVSMLFVK